MWNAVSEALAVGKREGIAAFRSAALEGAISTDFTRWRLPCLIYVGAEDEMHEGAARAAAEIPDATFLSLPGHTHFSAERVGDQLLPHVSSLFASASRTL
jgi:hypothetical protein